MNERELPRDRSAYRHFATEVIRFGDLDRHEHVNNVAICSYIEDARVRLRQDHFLEIANDPAVSWLVVSFAVEFHGAIGYPGTVEIGTAVRRIGTSSYTLTHGVFSGGECCATAETVTVCGDRQEGGSRPLPEGARQAFESLMLETSSSA